MTGVAARLLSDGILQAGFNLEVRSRESARRDGVAQASGGCGGSLDTTKRSFRRRSSSACVVLQSRGGTSSEEKFLARLLLVPDDVLSPATSDQQPVVHMSSELRRRREGAEEAGVREGLSESNPGIWSSKLE
mmetsp:Transcript_20804/g.30984  ORF Transcript_20804/g.30984 Transcript_20804/m.30984 type:complete len:133 (+) Transcript_20804:215-613(+)